MASIAESLRFGVAILFLLLGVVGVMVPIVPGIFLMWLTITFFGLASGFEPVTVPWYVVITFWCLVTGTADIWLTLLGSKSLGASKRSILYGIVGALIGILLGQLLIVGQIPGALLGYGAGVLYGEYRKHGNWRQAFKASLGGLAGWGLATMVQLFGALTILALFLYLTLR